MDKEITGGIWEEVEPLLMRVERPSRYLGGEWNAPGISNGGTKTVLAYPDEYEIGISNLGLSILQEVVNDIDGASCERAYSPWVDMEREMRDAGVPLFSLETHRPVSTYDIFGISMPHELTCTNILNLIDLAGIPLRSGDRAGGPLVVGGGFGVANPEPLAEFFDIFVLGEGEEALGFLVELVGQGKSRGWDREKLLSEAARLPGFYRPSDYRVEYTEDGGISAIVPSSGAQKRVAKNVVDIEKWLYPQRPIVPFCEAVHDRVNVEIFRGCTRGCRFCQAGMICRPVRERSAASVLKMVADLAGRTGHEEVSLASLSSTDYTVIEEVARKASGICDERQMVLSLPSLRMDGISVELVAELDIGGHGGMTFAPEAGSERLRRVINKPISEKDMVDAVLGAVRNGRRRIKLYFMIGLPTETDDDVEAISSLVFRLRDLVRSEGHTPPAFNISVSTFVPKPHTPFQWARQESLESIERKQRILQKTLRARGIKLSWHDARMSIVESLLARGDRRLADVIERVWKSGGRFDSWSEHFEFSLWEQALRQCGLDPAFYLYRERGADEVFPWEHLNFGPERVFLYEEYRRSIEQQVSPDCRLGECLECGACGNPGAGMALEGNWG